MKTKGYDLIHPPSMAVGPDGDIYNSTSTLGYESLTKREYFAAMAMQGHFDSQGCEDRIAELCVKMADALIAELNKEQKWPKQRKLPSYGHCIIVGG